MYPQTYAVQSLRQPDPLVNPQPTLGLRPDVAEPNAHEFLDAQR